MEFISNLAIAFNHGGFWMWPIAMLQIASIAIIAERFWVLFKNRKTTQMAFVNSFEDNIRRGELETVLEKAQTARDTEPVARALAAGTKAALAFGGKDEIQGKMDEVLLHENGLLDRRVGFLSMIGNVATLTGLLGTITGMIKSFAAVSYANPAEKAALLAAGISEAMNATAYGLIVAIPALLAYSVLQNRSNLLAEDLNQAGLKAFNWLSYSYDPMSIRPVAPTARNAGAQANNRELNA